MFKNNQIMVYIRSVLDVYKMVSRLLMAACKYTFISFCMVCPDFGENIPMYLVRIALVFTGTIHNHINVTSLQVKNTDVVMSPVLEIDLLEELRSLSNTYFPRYSLLKDICNYTLYCSETAPGF